jgi:hypothetical protein
MSLVRCLFSHLVERCEQRGYDIHNVMPCIKHIDEDYVIVDTEHMAYPAAKKTPAEIEAQAKKVQEYYQAHSGDALKHLNLSAELHALPAGINAIPSNLTPSVIGRGPGTELKKMLSKIGIKASPTCSCNARAQTMDANGIEWCKANTDTIVGWLREEATKRGLPFVDLAGKIIVKRAISLAETAEKKRKQAEEANPAQNG